MEIQDKHHSEDLLYYILGTKCRGLFPSSLCQLQRKTFPNIPVIAGITQVVPLLAERDHGVIHIVPYLFWMP